MRCQSVPNCMGLSANVICESMEKLVECVAVSRWQRRVIELQGLLYNFIGKIYDTFGMAADGAVGADIVRVGVETARLRQKKV